MAQVCLRPREFESHSSHHSDSSGLQGCGRVGSSPTRFTTVAAQVCRGEWPRGFESHSFHHGDSSGLQGFGHVGSSPTRFTTVTAQVCRGVAAFESHSSHIQTGAPRSFKLVQRKEPREAAERAFVLRVEVVPGRLRTLDGIAREEDEGGLVDALFAIHFHDPVNYSFHEMVWRCIERDDLWAALRESRCIVL